MDPTRSQVRRVDEGIRVVLLVPDLSLPGSGVRLRLRSGEKVFRHEATAHTSDKGTVVEASLGPRRWGRRAWQLAVQAEDGPFVPVGARLLAAPGQPVALLPGPAPDTRMPPPAAGGGAASPLDRVVRRVRRSTLGARHR